MAVTPEKLLLFLGGVVIAGSGVAYGTGVFDPYLTSTVPAQSSKASEPPAKVAALPAGDEAAAAKAPVPAASSAPALPTGDAITKPLDTEKADKPTVPAEAGPSPAAADAPTGVPVNVRAPSFDLVRVESDGSIVVAGKASPRAKIELLAGTRIIGSGEAGDEGDFAIVIDEPLKPGDYQVVLRQTGTDKVVAMSAETAVVSVPETPSGQVLALVEQPGKASQLITKPEPPKPLTSGAAAGAPVTGADTGAAAPASPAAANSTTGGADAPAVKLDSGSGTAAAPDTASGSGTEAAASSAPTSPDARTHPDTASKDDTKGQDDVPAESASAQSVGKPDGPAATSSNDATKADASDASSAVDPNDSATAPAPTPPSVPPAAVDAVADTTKVPDQPPLVEKKAGTVSAGAETGEQTMASAEPDKPATQLPQPAGKRPIMVEAVEIEGRTIFVAGSGDPGSHIRAYANDILLGDDVVSAGGRFLVQAERELKVGDYIVRVDVLAPDGVKVLSRAAVPFQREAGESVAAVASPASADAATNTKASTESTDVESKTANSQPATKAGAAAPAAETKTPVPGTASAEAGNTARPPATTADTSKQPEAVAGTLSPAGTTAAGSQDINVASAKSGANSETTKPAADAGAGKEAAQGESKAAPVASAPSASQQNPPAAATVAGSADKSQSPPPSAAAAETVDTTAPETLPADADNKPAPPAAAADVKAAETAPAVPPATASGQPEPFGAAGPKAADATEAPLSVTSPPAVQTEAAASTPDAPTPSETLAPKLQNVSGAVIIRRGDTLWRISQRVYGLGTRYSTIYLANQPQIQDPDRIWPGQVFSVPQKSKEGESADLQQMGAQAVTPVPN